MQPNQTKNYYTKDGQVLTEEEVMFETHYDESGRRFVGCDDDCDAYDDPQSLEEFQAAYTHWREHGYLYGCSHAC